MLTPILSYLVSDKLWWKESFTPSKQIYDRPLDRGASIVSSFLDQRNFYDCTMEKNKFKTILYHFYLLLPNRNTEEHADQNTTKICHSWHKFLLLVEVIRELRLSKEKRNLILVSWEKPSKLWCDRKFQGQIRTFMYTRNWIMPQRPTRMPRRQ